MKAFSESLNTHIVHRCVMIPNDDPCYTIIDHVSAPYSLYDINCRTV